MSSQQDYIIRFAERDDAEGLATLAGELLVQEGDSVEHFDSARFIEDAFGDTPQFSVLLAARGRELIGYALFHDAYEPSHAARGVYLCDLYVKPAFRGHGIGRSLIARVARDTAARGRTYVWWVAREANEAARSFYRTLADVEMRVTAHAITDDRFRDLASR